jgi:N-acetylneuraminic acid mutarotase
MKRSLIILFAVLALPHFGLSQANTWLAVADFAGGPTMYPVSFSINDEGYVGLGTDSAYSQNLWKFDPATDTWSQCASFPGNGRIGAASFVIGSTAYVGCGQNNTVDFSDFWKYDAVSNQWTPIANFPGTSRCWASAFQANNRGYVGCGRDFQGQNFYSDFWQYLPVNDSWTLVASIPVERCSAPAFTINNRGYLLGGYNIPSGELGDMWKYDPSVNLWSACSNVPNAARGGGFAFSVDGQGYFGCGGGAQVYIADFSRYDPASDSWTPLSPPTSDYRISAPTFVCHDTAYMGMGWWGMNDFWKFYPDANVGISEAGNRSVVVASPNPADEIVFLSLNDPFSNESLVIRSHDLHGKLARTEVVACSGDRVSFERGNLIPGVYMLDLTSESGEFIGRIKVIFR